MNTEKYVLNDAGEAVSEPDLMKWGAWMGKAERHVAYNATPGGARVSTVFLGLDHSWDAGPPILWETMIFGGKEDGYQERFSSREDAVAGHAKALQLALKAEAPEPSNA
jgi:hypothetical protein